MKKQYRLLSVLILATVLTFTLSGCGSQPGFTLNPQELYVRPELPAKYTRLSSLLNELVGSGAEYAAPTSGSNIQSVQMIDLDGDGHEEAVAYFRQPGDEKPLKICIFTAGDDSYQLTNRIEASGTSIYSVAYEDLDNDGIQEICVGWKAAAELQVLEVYAYTKTETRTLLRTDYVKYITADLDADGRRELVVLHASEDGDSMADYYNWQTDGSLVRRARARISVTMAELSQAGRVRAGVLRDGTPALFVTGVTTSSVYQPATSRTSTTSSTISTTSSTTSGTSPTISGTSSTISGTGSTTIPITSGTTSTASGGSSGNTLADNTTTQPVSGTVSAVSGILSVMSGTFGVDSSSTTSGTSSTASGNASSTSTTSGTGSTTSGNTSASGNTSGTGTTSGTGATSGSASGNSSSATSGTSSSGATSGNTSGTASTLSTAPKQSMAVIDILTLRDGEFTNIVLDPATGISRESAVFCTLYPSDINSDDKTEVPRPVILQSGSNEDSACYLIEWKQYDLSGEAVSTLYTCHDLDDGWYLRLPDSWSQEIYMNRTTSVTSVTGEAAVTFYTRQTGQPLFRISALTGSGRDMRSLRGDRFIISRQMETIYTAELLDGSNDWESAMSEEEIRAAFTLISREWLSGDN